MNKNSYSNGMEGHPSGRAINKSIAFGVDHAVNKNWKKVDEEILPEIENQLEGETEEEVTSALYENSMNLLGNSNPNLRDYGATLTSLFFKKEGYNSPEQMSLVRKLKDCAYSDESVWARFRASTALVEAEENRGEGIHPINLDTDNLFNNFYKAGKESSRERDKDLIPVIRDYMIKLRKMGKTDKTSTTNKSD